MSRKIFNMSASAARSFGDDKMQILPIDTVDDNENTKKEESPSCHVCILPKLGSKTEGMECRSNKLNSNQESFHCGVCSQTFCTICHLHNHLKTFHLLNGSYHYDFFIQTAFPKYESLCQFTQTENADFNREGVYCISGGEINGNFHNLHKSDIGNVFINGLSKKCKQQKASSISNKADEASEHSLSVGSDFKDADVKVEPEEISESEVGVKATVNDGYSSDRTDDYFANEEEMLTDQDTANHFDDLSFKDGNTASCLRMELASNSAAETKIHKKKSKNNTLSKRNREIKSKSMVSKRKNLTDIDANTTVLKKFGAKSKTRKQIGRIKDIQKSKEPKKSKSLNNANNCIDKLTDNTLISLKTVNEKLSKDKDFRASVTKKKDKNEENKCEVCHANFTVKQGLLRHEQVKHSDLLNFNCNMCDKKFMRNFNLQKHIIRAHGGRKSIKLKSVKDQSFKKEAGSFPQEVIPDDLYSGISDEINVQEGSQAEDVTSNGEIKSVRRKRRTNEEMKSLKIPHTCELCGHTMPRSKMDVHKRLHSGERPFICNVCGKGLISQNKLSRHMLIHGEVKRHTCEICGVGFHMKYKLRMHMHIHTGKKPYLCSICGAEFNHSANLATHTRCVHLQVKPYICNICGGKYSKRSQLDDHVLSHSTERQFTCRYCGKSFKYFKGMRRHEKSHNEEESFTCNLCGLKFARKETLDRHKVSHGEDSFQCKTCKKVLKDSRALQEHEFTHLVAKGCKCFVCGEMFYSSNKYFTHLFTMHSIQKQDAQLMIIDEKLQKDNKKTDAHPLDQLTSSSGINLPVNGSVSSFNTSVSGILDTASKDTMSVLTRVATENLRLHSQDVKVEEKNTLIIPPLNPMIIYEKARIASLDSTVGNNGGFSLEHKVMGNTMVESLNFPDHAYGQSLKQQVDNHGGHHGNMTHSDTSLQHQGLNENVLGFVTSNALTSINNLTSYMGQRQTSLTPLTNLTTGLHQDEHGAIESLRRLQDNTVIPVTLISNTGNMVANQGQQNIVMSVARSNEGNAQSDYRIQNLY